MSWACRCSMACMQMMPKRNPFFKEIFWDLVRTALSSLQHSIQAKTHHKTKISRLISVKKPTGVVLFWYVLNMFEPWAPGKVDGPMDRSKSGPPTRAKMSDKTPANDEDCHSCGSWVNPQTSYLPYLSISIHIYPYLSISILSIFGRWSTRVWTILDSHPNFMEWPPNLAEWHVLQSDCLFFFLFFSPTWP